MSLRNFKWSFMKVTGQVAVKNNHYWVTTMTLILDTFIVFLNVYDLLLTQDFCI